MATIIVGPVVLTAENLLLAAEACGYKAEFKYDKYDLMRRKLVDAAQELDDRVRGQ